MKSGLKEDPFFALYLDLPKRQQIIEKTDFFNNAVKFIIDADEYLEWFMSPSDNENGNYRESTFGSDDVLGSIPFSVIWVEFYNIKKGECISITFEEGDPEVAAFGYSLKTKKLFYVGRDAEIKMVDFDKIPEKSEAGENMAALHFVSQYLQTEFVNATRRSFTFGRKLNKKGKIVGHISSYSIIYRKQPEQRILGTSQQEIEWQHRWKVRGHWRRIKGEGRGPDGEKLDGFTWVRECIKGPEDKPLLDRPRIFKNQLPPRFIEEPK